MNADARDAGPWKVLLVDDEPAVHQISRLILAGLECDGRGIELLSAESAAQARELLAREGELALVLLDVVMESDDAGLVLVRHIREQRGDRLVQIVLRTGQPGVAPEREVVAHHEINGYWLKTDLTAQRLRTVVVAALRSYRLAQEGRLRPDGQPAPASAGAQALAMELACVRGDAVLWQAQPEVALATNSIEGIELVPLWKTSTGMLSAAQVFGTLADTEARRAHAANLVAQACAWAGTWHAAGAALTVTVPGVGECLDDEETLARVEAIAREAALPRGVLQLLVGARQLQHGSSLPQRALQCLRAVGAGLTLGDVGASALSLRQLAHPAFQRLKIHRLFVRNIGADPGRMALARSVIALAHTLHRVAIADGITSDGDAQFFRWEGCPLAQGDALAPACAPADVLGLVRAQAH